MTELLTVACVLRSGGDYRREHVIELAAAVARNLTIPHAFVCLSNSPIPSSAPILRIPLVHNWPGWWSKIELFRPGLFPGPVLYFDLDTRIVGSLDELALGHRFTVLRNFWADVYGEPDRIGSGVMAWNGEAAAGIYQAFRVAPLMFMREYKTKARWGDQAFIKDHAPLELDRWQDLHPGKIVSFKRHVSKRGRIPPGARVVAFHGQPRPWALTRRQSAIFEGVSTNAVVAV